MRYTLIYLFLMVAFNMPLYGMNSVLAVQEESNNNNPRSIIKEFLEDPSREQFNTCCDIINLKTLLHRIDYNKMRLTEEEMKKIDVIAHCLNEQKVGFDFQLNDIESNGNNISYLFNGNTLNMSVGSAVQSNNNPNFFHIDTDEKKYLLLTFLIQKKENHLTESIAKMRRSLRSIIHFASLYCQLYEHFPTGRT